MFVVDPMCRYDVIRARVIQYWRPKYNRRVHNTMRTSIEGMRHAEQPLERNVGGEKGKHFRKKTFVLFFFFCINEFFPNILPLNLEFLSGRLVRREPLPSVRYPNGTAESRPPQTTEISMTLMFIFFGKITVDNQPLFVTEPKL